MARISIEDLEFASTWMDAYDGAEDDENNQRAERIVAWLDAEIARRREDALVRKVRDSVEASNGVRPTAAAARAALRNSALNRTHQEA